MTSRLTRSTFALFVACGLFAPAAWPTAAPQLAGIYTSLALNEESSDLLGMEIMLVPAVGEGKYHAFVQLAEGSLPLVTTADVQVKRNSFGFSLDTGSGLPPLKFQCAFKGKSLECTDGETKEVLKRGKSYWQ